MRNSNLTLVNEFNSYTREPQASVCFSERWARLITLATFQYQAKLLSIFALLIFSS